MPIYEYECAGCAHRFELKRSFNDKGEVACPACGCITQRVFSSVPVIFKGSGFYVNDYKKKSQSPPAEDKGEVKSGPEVKKSGPEVK